jgi:uncharacterized protein
MSARVIHFEIQADNMDRAKDFYEKALGWEVKKYEGPAVGMEYWMLSTGPEGTPGINGGMYKRPTKDANHTYDCTVLVEDIDKTIEAVRAAGGIITREKSLMEGLGWFAGALDTEGNKFGIMQATDWQPK